MNKLALKFTSLNQLSRLVSGPFILLILPVFLSGEQQGFWFAMTSLAAMTSFADMGLSTVVLQCAAHEYAKAKRAEVNGSEASCDHKERLAALLIYSTKRIALIAGIALPVVFGTGFFVLSNSSGTENWVAPWTLFCLTSSLSLILTAVLSYFEGCDEVAKIQKLRFLIAMTNVSIIGIGLVSGIGLWTLSVASGVSTLLGWVLLWNQQTSNTLNRRNVHPQKIKLWHKEISPLLLKYSASWGGGYLMFQLFTPIMFKMHGAIEAGKVGLTMALFTAIFSISNVFSSYQLPQFSMAIALRDRSMLEKCLSTAIKGSLTTYLLLTAAIIFSYFVLHSSPNVASKFLSIEAILVLSLAWMMQLIVHNLAVYLRAFKEEPLAWQTIIAAIYTVAVTFICSTYGGSTLFFLGFLTVYFWFMPVTFLLFKQKREITKLWIND